ncbi:hypothetical protein Btru_008993 [Bulinus truncatus]|nr:hypothetical protein Btru_008993 [Bulinus truncatus]
MTTITEDDVDQYLKDHPQFLATWLLDNADDDTLRVVARKFKQDALSQITFSNGQLAKGMPAVEERDSTGSLSEDSMSADPSEDKHLQRYRSFSKVGRNSITSMIFRKYLDGDRSRRSSVKKDLDDLKRMSEQELFMELIRDIASELDVNVLCHKILQVKNSLKAKGHSFDIKKKLPVQRNCQIRPANSNKSEVTSGQLLAMVNGDARTRVRFCGRGPDRSALRSRDYRALLDPINGAGLMHMWVTEEFHCGKVGHLDEHATPMVSVIDGSARYRLFWRLTGACRKA